MKRFTKLYTALDQTTKTTAKVAALAEYFAIAPPADAVWAIYFLSGGKIRRLIPTKLLRRWSAEAADIEEWMFSECYEIVGDLAELMALILPPATTESDLPLHVWVTEMLDPVRNMPATEQRAAMNTFWSQLHEQQRFVLHKLVTGSFRVGVSRRLVVQGLAKHCGLTPEVLSHRLMGDWKPTSEFYLRLLDPDTLDAEISQPYPFYLAHPLEHEPATLGDVDEWTAEWKWDGIRAQILKRENEIFIWSRGEDLMTERFPELVEIAERLPNGIALDGEIVGFKEGQIMPFTDLQRRIGRKKLGPKILGDVPVGFIAFDLLEWQSNDVRQQTQDWRRDRLATVVQQAADSQTDARVQSNFHLSEILLGNTWQSFAELRQTARQRNAEGLMLKRRAGSYRVGRPRGDWWKWKVDPYTVDAVMIYAQRGHGRRASLYTDCTFAVWDDDKLVPFAKAYSGLTDAEIRRVDRFVRNNTLERFGPVRSVTAELVFELAFENIQPSKRHKSGIAVRFPRISRWREDLKIEDADSLDTIRSMMNSFSDSVKSK